MTFTYIKHRIREAPEINILSKNLKEMNTANLQKRNKNYHTIYIIIEN